MLVRLRRRGSHCHRVISVRGLTRLQKVALTRSNSLHVNSTAAFARLVRSPVARHRLPTLYTTTASVTKPRVHGITACNKGVYGNTADTSSTAPALVCSTGLRVRSPHNIHFIPVGNFRAKPNGISLRRSRVLITFRFPPRPGRRTNDTRFGCTVHSTVSVSAVNYTTRYQLSGNGFDRLHLTFNITTPAPVHYRRTRRATRGTPLGLRALRTVDRSILRSITPHSS